MRLSIETYGLLNRFDDEAAFTLLKNAGFDACDYSLYDQAKRLLGDDYMDNARHTKEALEKVGFVCNQAHAPFDMKEGQTFDESNINYLHIVRSIEYAAFLGAENIIVHLIITKNRDEMYDYNQKFYKTLIPYCEKFGIRVAVENNQDVREDRKLPILCDPDLLQQFVRDLNSEYMVACVDVGHAAMFGNPATLIEGMENSILRALHIHDNDLQDDLHLFPYTCKINWDSVCSALGKIGYQGDLTFEVINGLYRIPDELKLDAYVFLAKVGRYMINQVANYRK